MADNNLNISITATDAASARIKELQAHIEQMRANLLALGDTSKGLGAIMATSMNQAIAANQAEIASLGGVKAAVDSVTAAFERQGTAAETAGRKVASAASSVPAFIRPTPAAEAAPRAAPAFIRPPTPLLPSQAARPMADYDNAAVDARTRQVREQVRLHNQLVEAMRREEEAAMDIARAEAEYINQGMKAAEAKQRAEAEYHNSTVDAIYKKQRAEAEYENAQRDAEYDQQRAMAEYEDRDRDMAAAKARRAAEEANRRTLMLQREQAQTGVGIVSAHSPELAAGEAAARASLAGLGPLEQELAARKALIAATEQQVRALEAVYVAETTAAAAGASASEVTAVGARAATMAYRDQAVATKEAGAASGFLQREMRHIVGIFDALSRGQMGQAMSSLASGMRDAGISAMALGTSVGGLVAFMAVRHVLKSAEDLGKWATEARAAASAAGMSVHAYTQLQGALALSGMKTTEADAALKQLAEHVGEAIANPLSKAADGFRALNITIDQLKATGGDLNKVMDLWADAWVKNADGAEKTAAAEAAAGKGFERLIPLVQDGAAALEQKRQKADELGTTLNDKTATSLENTGRHVTTLGETIRGQGISAMESWGPTIGVLSDILQGFISVLGKASDAVAFLVNKMGDLLSMPLPSWLGGGLFVPDKSFFDKKFGTEQYGPPPPPEPKRQVPPIITASERGKAIALEAQQAEDAAAQHALATHMSTRKAKEAEDQAYIAVLKKHLNDEGVDRDALQKEIASKETSMTNTMIAEANKRNTGAAKAAHQAYEDFAGAERLKIQAAQGSAQQILAIYNEWIAAAQGKYKQHVSVIEALEKQKADAVSRALMKQLEDEKRLMDLQEKAAKVSGEAERLSTGKPDTPATAQSYRQQAAEIEAIAQRTIQQYQEVMKIAGKGTEAYKEAQEKILQTIVDAKQKEIELYKKAAEEVKKQTQAFTQFFDKLGSSMEQFMSSAVDALISPQVNEYKVGLTTIKESMRGQQIAQAFQSMMKSAISDVAGTVTHALGSVLAKALSGGTASSIGDLLGNLLSKAFSSIFGSGIGSAVGGAAGSAPTVAAITAQTGALTGAIATGATATVTGVTGATVALGTTTTGAITGQTAVLAPLLSALAVKPSVLGTTFGAGGIVPSAAGGMMVGGVAGQGQLSILHPQEMVLPAPISRAIQAMIGRETTTGGNVSNASLNYSPTINTSSRSRGGTGMSRGEFQQMMSSHGGSMLGEAANLMRSGWRPGF